MNRLRIPAVVAALAASCALGATFDAVAQRGRDAGAQALPAVDIPFETFTLDNGLRVVVSTDRKAPVVAVGVWYAVGSRDEPAGKTGFAHLFEHLMFNGTENFNQEYFEPLQSVGATDMNGTTWFDRTNYFQTVPNTALDLALWMESDRMGHLLGVVDQARLDEQRGVVQNEKRQGDNRPYGLVEYSMLAGLFPAGHPYSWSTIGSMQDLDAASLEDVRAWFRERYGAANAVLAIVGDVDTATARRLVEKYFGDIDPGPPVARREAAVPIRASNTHDTLRDRVPQARIYRSWAAPGLDKREAMLLSLAADVLGQGKSSRLYETLVYEKKIATDVVAYLEQHELASMLAIELTLADGVSVADGARELDEQVELFLAGEPTSAELDRVRMVSYASFVRGIERVGGRSGKTVVLAEGWLYADDPGFYRRELQWMRDARPQDVAAAAREWMRHGYHQVDVVPFGNLSAGAEHADRSKLPAVDRTPELTFPAIERATLSNGAKLVVAQREGAPVVELLAQFGGGFNSDLGGPLGLASFTTNMLEEGTATRSALQIAAEAERLGATLSAGATLGTSDVRVSALKASLAPTLALMADVIRNPAFAPAEIERVRNIWLAQIAQEKAQPASLALRLMPRAIYGAESPYGTPLTGSGNEASIRDLTRDDLVRFHRERIRPDNVTFFVVGDIDVAAATTELEAALRGWSAPAEPVRPIASVTAAERAAPRLILVDRPNAPQSLIYVGRATTPAAAPSALAQIAMNTVFGGQFTARINMNLREDKHWSYGVRSSFLDAPGPRPWFISAPVQTDKTVESVAELRKEISELNGGRPISAEEFEFVRTQGIRALPGSFETAANVLSAIAGAASAGRPLDWSATLAGRYRALSLAEARAAAAEIVKPEELVWVVVGDRAQIEAGLRSLNVAPLELWDEDGQPVT
jgi:zinc protease